MTRTEQRRNKVKKEAINAYERWGHYIVECYTDEELDEHIAGFVKCDGKHWFKELRKYWKDYQDYADDIRAEAF